MTNVSEAYTVRASNGELTVDALKGHVLPHEHLILDLRVWWEGDGEWDVLDAENEGVTEQNLFAHRHRPQGTSRENLVLADWYLAALELRKARDVGCTLLVDTTTTGLHPEPTLALRAARLAGVPVVLSVGRYIDPALSDDDRAMPSSELRNHWVRQIEEAPAERQIGIIGEIGTSDHITPAELRSLEAAAMTQLATGLPINVHLDPAAQAGHQVLDILQQHGASLGKVALSHCDAHIDQAYIASLAARGAYVEFDLFGTDHEWAIDGLPFSNDNDRMEAIGALIAAGYADSILLSHDICMKNALTRYGGWGYGHLGREILPKLRSTHGDDLVTTLSARNPLRFLAPVARGDSTRTADGIRLNDDEKD